jgi:hypothetical protein
MHDVVDWSDLLHRDVTAVEEPSARFDENLSDMLAVAAANNINLEVLRGKIEKIMLSGRSLDSERPRYATFAPGDQLCMAYDLVNLDFDGGLGNALLRHRSVEALLKAQSSTSFTLFITYNVRSKLGEQIADELANLSKQIEPDGEQIAGWYKRQETPVALRLKAVIPVVVSTAAATALMDCRSYPPIRYVGYKGATLVHFAFDLTPHPDAFRAHHPGMRRLITMPLFDSVDGTIRVSDLQDPAFDAGRCFEELEFLPDKVRKGIVGSIVSSPS